MFNPNDPDSPAPILHNAHVVAWRRGNVGYWNSIRLFGDEDLCNSLDGLVNELMSLYRYECQLGRINCHKDLCFQCGELAFESSICIACEV